MPTSTYHEPTCGSYGRGENGRTFTDARGVTYWFSYRTLVALQVPGHPMIVRENAWGPTTGRHLSEIDGGTRDAKDARLSGDAFKQRAADLLA